MPEVCSRPGGIDRPAGDCVLPRASTGHEIKPGLCIRLDHIGRCATGVPRPLDALHSTERRHPNLHRMPRLVGRELLQRKANGAGQSGAINVTDRRPARRSPIGLEPGAFVDASDGHAQILCRAVATEERAPPAEDGRGSRELWHQHSAMPNS